MSTDAFQRRDSGMLYEVLSDDAASVTLRAYDEGHTVETVTRADFDAHFDPTATALQVDSVTGDGAGGVRLACSGRVVHLTAAQIAAINAAAANAP